MPARSTGRLRRSSGAPGSQFDPTIADAFVAAYAAGEIVAAEPLSIAV